MRLTDPVPKIAVLEPTGIGTADFLPISATREFEATADASEAARADRSPHAVAYGGSALKRLRSNNLYKSIFKPRMEHG
jgi:hypothetical protein